ncbi:hypothetical protein RUND412_009237 [Rhizina undulata]
MDRYLNRDQALFLTPPELFAFVIDGPTPIYRCSSVELANRSFLKTLNLKTIVYLAVEKPSKALRAISEEQHINLVHLGLWQASTWEAFTPLSKQAVEKTLRYFTREHLPLLLVDSGHGIFVGVLRKLLGWNHTSIILEYRSFAGQHPRYANEEFIEMVDTSNVVVPEGIDFLPVHTAAPESPTPEQKTLEQRPTAEPRITAITPPSR